MSRTGTSTQVRVLVLVRSLGFLGGAGAGGHGPLEEYPSPGCPCRLPATRRGLEGQAGTLSAGDIVAGEGEPTPYGCCWPSSTFRLTRLRVVGVAGVPGHRRVVDALGRPVRPRASPQRRVERRGRSGVGGGRRVETGGAYGTDLVRAQGEDGLRRHRVNPVTRSVDLEARILADSDFRRVPFLPRVDEGQTQRTGLSVEMAEQRSSFRVRSRSADLRRSRETPVDLSTLYANVDGRPRQGVTT